MSSAAKELSTFAKCRQIMHALDPADARYDQDKLDLVNRKIQDAAHRRGQSRGVLRETPLATYVQRRRKLLNMSE
jgi:hypothetical protein